jgi:hypothetical protein
MLKMKTILPVFVVLLFLGVASTAFAQVSCNVASTPVSRDSTTGFTEPAGDITFNCIQTGGSASTPGATITVSYGLPITNDTTFPNGAPYSAVLKPISVAATSSGTASCPAVAAGGVAVSNLTGQVVITMGAVAPGLTAGNSCSYTLTGVLLGISGTGATSVIATVSVSPGNNLLITAGQNTPTVVTSVLAPIIASGVVVKTGPGIVPTSGANASFNSSFSITVTENYIDMFRDGTTFNGGASSNGVQLKYTFAGIPTGATIANCVGSVTTGAVTTSAATASSTVNSITVTIGAGISLSAIDTVTLACGTTGVGALAGFTNGTATLPFTAGSITATISLAPVGTAFSSTNTVLSNPATTGQIPRYSGPSFGPFPVINIVPLTTHMIYPYVAVGNGFDTGLVIANTTADPYGSAAGGALPLGGPVTIAFYPAGGGTAFCISTGAGAAAVAGITSCTTTTAGTGLTSGSVASGSSYVVLASQLFAAVTGAPSSFTGYAFAIANFPFAHPTGFVADAAFSGKFASGGPALVIPNPAVAGRQATAGWVTTLTESLGH